MQPPAMGDPWLVGPVGFGPRSPLKAVAHLLSPAVTMHLAPAADG